MIGDAAAAELDPATQRELDGELGRWQRRRAAMASLVLAGLLGIAIVESAMRRSTDAAAPSTLIDEAVDLSLCALCVAMAVFFWTVPLSRAMGVRVIGWFLMFACGTALVACVLMLTYDSTDAFPAESPDASAVIAGLSALTLVLVLHLTFSAFVALPPWPAIWPLLPVWALFAAMVVSMNADQTVRITLVLLFPLAGLPGVLWSVWRHDRFVNRFVSRVWHDRYGELRRELADARRLHDALLPERMDIGDVRLRYAYEPMREIGGDFVYAVRAGERAVLAVLVDVTGHGVASALAVNRIHSELTRLGAEAATTTPGHVLEALNRFVADSLAGQGVYATALALIAESDTGRVRWASAGHPPALLRRRDGSIEELPATAPMLGVLDAEAFEHGECEARLAPGESLVAFTDGLIEAWDETRTMFGTEGARAALRATDGDDVSDALLQASRRFRRGPVCDDTLVVVISRASLPL